MTNKSNKIIEEIGQAAVLEQCAEECAELAHACLKMARKLRGENPTPKQYNELKYAIREEICDVELLLSMLIDSLKISVHDMIDIMNAKESRWLDRIEEHKKQEE